MLSNDLNPQQLQAVRHSEGPLMVVAGAGSGKTRVITCRIAYLIESLGVRPEHILAITFTNKAAGEMKERVQNMLNFPEASPWISTFHSFCLRVLRQHISELGYSTDFFIYDAQDQLSLLKECMKSASINDEAFPPRSLLSHISGFKNDFLLPENINLDTLPYGNRLKAAELYPVYQEGLRKNNALDFDDLLILTVRLLREVPSVCERFNKRFKYILVDEFQDTNATQYHLIRLLSREHNNVCVVGDDDQSIYRWRGANLGNILNFEKDFAGATVIKLEENYRSTKNILKAASGVVEENVNRKPKTLWTQNEEGAPVVYYRAEDETDEAKAVCDRILELYREESIPFNEMAVLYRTNAQSRVMEDVLRGMDIPYQVLGGLRFYERKEIKDILAFIRVILNPGDAVSLRRIINVPPRGIGKTSLSRVEAWCREKDQPLIAGLKQALSARLTGPAAGKKMLEFVALLDRLKTVLEHHSIHDFLAELLERTGYGTMLNKENSPESRSRLENLRELFSAVEQFVEEGSGTLQEYLDSIALVSDIDNVDDSRGVLPLMTLHTCKGLEFKVVFIIGMENGLLPHASSMSDNEEYEEERRLCYVGFTRAKQKLFVCNARRRRIYGNTLSYAPSDFLMVVPPEVMVKEMSPNRERYSSAASFPSYTYSDLPSGKEESVDRGDATYPVGTKVLHPTFGAGVVINREGSVEDLKVEIFFKRPFGKKKLAVNHAKLIVL